MTEITIISGFLGAGKTTLIKKLLEEVFKGEKIVLIENEFGEIGIDGGFLKEAGVQVNEMNSGCICCSLVGDFGTALKEVIDTYAPDRILIEPSGVGKLSDVMKAVQNVAGHMDVHIDSSIVVVDGKKCKMYMKNFGEFFNNQVEHAGTIVLSRTQSMTEEKLAEAVKMLREHNDKATMITTPWEQLNGKQILDAMKHAELDMGDLDQDDDDHEHEHHHDHDHEHEHHHDHDHEHHHDDDHDHGEGCTCGCHDHDHHHHHHDHDGHHHADEVFTSWGVETPKRFSREELEKILETLSKSGLYGLILRAKGIIQNTDGSWMEFDFVPEEYEIREGNPDYTGRLCVIGSLLDEDGLKELFGV
ncbi:CobW family GTP-binding protein [Laedolimicola intestinihominis]|uniref:GTP-binding protein n=1 Tax=Laedolimicola intestinihominis TaxID=3133166 RepID=A0ABV1FLH6_9FIRM